MDGLSPWSRQHESSRCISSKLTTLHQPFPTARPLLFFLLLISLEPPCFSLSHAPATVRSDLPRHSRSLINGSLSLPRGPHWRRSSEFMEGNDGGERMAEKMGTESGVVPIPLSLARALLQGGSKHIEIAARNGAARNRTRGSHRRQATAKAKANATVAKAVKPSPSKKRSTRRWRVGSSGDETGGAAGSGSTEEGAAAARGGGTGEKQESAGAAGKWGKDDVATARPVSTGRAAKPAPKIPATIPDRGKLPSVSPKVPVAGKSNASVASPSGSKAPSTGMPSAGTKAPSHGETPTQATPGSQTKPASQTKTRRPAKTPSRRGPAQSPSQAKQPSTTLPSRPKPPTQAKPSPAPQTTKPPPQTKLPSQSKPSTIPKPPVQSKPPAQTKPPAQPTPANQTKPPIHSKPPAEAKPPGQGKPGGAQPKMQLFHVSGSNSFCLDGSPPAYYFRQGYGTGSNSWLVYLHGGGWCINFNDCASRADSYRGSSRFWPSPSSPSNLTRLMAGYHMSFTGILSKNPADNPFFHNWNMAVVMYCDGGAYMGYRGRMQQGSKRVFLSGHHILRNILTELQQKRGMGAAASALIAGCSAGGQAVAVGCDWMASFLPRSAKVKCATDASFFLDEADITGQFTFRSFMQRMMASHWSDRSLNSDCLRANSGNGTWKCIMPRTALEYSKTPTLVVNSAFDLTALYMSLSRGKLPGDAAAQSATTCLGSNGFSSCPASVLKFIRTHGEMIRISISSLLRLKADGHTPFRAWVSNGTSHCALAYSNWSQANPGGLILRDAVATWFAEN